jgi:hypothetical protein
VDRSRPHADRRRARRQGRLNRGSAQLKVSSGHADDEGMSSPFAPPNPDTSLVLPPPQATLPALPSVVVQGSGVPPQVAAPSLPLPTLPPATAPSPAPSTVVPGSPILSLTPAPAAPTRPMTAAVPPGVGPRPPIVPLPGTPLGGGGSGRAQAKRQQSYGGVVAVLLLVALVAGVGFVARDTPFMRRVTGEGYADSPRLQPGYYPRPEWKSARYSTSTTVVGHNGDGVTKVVTIRSVVDSTFGVAAKKSRAWSSSLVVDSRIDESSATQGGTELVIDGTHAYEDNGAGTWTRTPREDRDASVLEPTRVLMQHDIVDVSLATLTPTASKTERRNGSDMTWVRYEIPAESWFESAPLLAGRHTSLTDGLTAGTTVTVELTVDRQGVVWAFKLSADQQAALAAYVGEPIEITASYELEAASLEPASISVPTTFVDGGGS